MQTECEPAPSHPSGVANFRQHWLLAPGLAFLNHGSFGACPRPILELQAQMRLEMEANPVRFLWTDYEKRLDPARNAVARFVGANARDLVFLPNATSAVNAVARSLRLKRGDQILTTSLDYNACRNVLVQATARSGARLVIAEVPFPVEREEAIIEAVLNAVTQRTRLALIDHVTSNTGLVLPVDRLVPELQARGVQVLVDGAHAPGMLDLDIRRLNPDYYTGNLHKWVCAPKGAAFLWAREDRQPHLHPPIVSHGYNTPRAGYSTFQDRFDWMGTTDPTPWFCAGAAIDWMGQLLPGGWPELRRRNRELAIAARTLLCHTLEMVPPCPENMLAALATIPLPGPFQGRPRTGKLDSEQVILSERHQIEVPFFRFGNPERRHIRISAQIYNSLDDYQRLAEALLNL